MEQKQSWEKLMLFEDSFPCNISEQPISKDESFEWRGNDDTLIKFSPHVGYTDESSVCLMDQV